MGRSDYTDPQCLYSTAIALLPLWAVRPVQCLSACRVQIYIYSPYGPYGLYKASLPVQYSYKSTALMGRTACTVPQCLHSTAIPLLPLWAVLPLQNLSACTVQLYLYSPYGTYILYRALVPVQYSYTSSPPKGRTEFTELQFLYSRAKPPLPLKDCTACTEPQCLYSTSIPLLLLWAVRPVQSLSACTVELYLYPLYSPYCLYRASVPVQYSYTSTAIIRNITDITVDCIISQISQSTVWYHR